MRIVVNGWPLLAKSGGIGVYTRELMRQFCRHDQENEYLVYGVTPGIKKAQLLGLGEDEDQAESGAVRVSRLPEWVRTVGRTVRNSRVGDAISRGRSLVARLELAWRGADVYFGPNFFGVFHPSFRTVITIHDMAYHYYPRETNPVMYRQLRAELPDHAHRAHAILADSVATRNDVINLLGVPGEKVEVVYPGVSAAFRRMDDEAVLRDTAKRYRLPTKFLLFVGTIEPRKNIPMLVAAFDLLCDAGADHGLVIAGGKGWRDERILAAIENCRHRERIVCTGFVADADLPALYNLADVLVMPSLYEGFGLPVLEALACGTNVVATNVSSLPEVVGGGGLLVESNSPEELTATLQRLLRDEALRTSLRSAGIEHAKRFSWENAAQQVIRVFERVHGDSAP